MIKTEKRNLELDEKLLFKLYTSNVLILAKQYLQSIPYDLREGKELKDAIIKIHKELELAEPLCKEYFK